MCLNVFSDFFRQISRLVSCFRIPHSQILWQSFCITLVHEYFGVCIICFVIKRSLMYTYVAKYKPCCITNDVLWDGKDCCVEWLAYGVSGKVRDSRTFDESVGFQNLEVGEVWSNSSNHTVRPGRAEAWEQTWTIGYYHGKFVYTKWFSHHWWTANSPIFSCLFWEFISWIFLRRKKRTVRVTIRNYWNHFLIWHDTTGRGMHWLRSTFLELLQSMGLGLVVFLCRVQYRKLPYFLVRPWHTRWLPFRSFDSDGTLAESRCRKPGIPKTFGFKARKQYVIKTIIIDHNIINECVELCVHCFLKLCIGIGLITVWFFLGMIAYDMDIIYECISGSYI